jgi:hypothetical protein
MIALLVLLPAEAIAAHPATARIVAQQPRERWIGSGTLVHKDKSQGIVLTCDHVAKFGAVTVLFPDGSRYEARRIGRDMAHDLTALVIAPPAAEPVAIATAWPRVGEPVTVAGYGPDGTYRAHTGRGVPTHETLEISGGVREGDSGGPMLNARGELVGVIWGTNGRVTGGAYCGRVRKFLGGIFGRCPPGGCPPTGPAAACPKCGRPDCINARPGRPQISVTDPQAIPAPGQLVPIAPAKPAGSPPEATPERDRPPWAFDLEEFLRGLGERPPITTNPPAPDPITTNPPVPIEALPPAPDPITANPPAVSTPTAWLEGVPWAELAALLCGAAGVGVPAWLISGARIAKLVRELRDRDGRPVQEGAGPDRRRRWWPRRSERTIVVDAPPAVERERLTTHFVNVESDHYQHAHELARRDIARRYPGAQEILEAELSLTRQYAAGLPQ